MNPGRYRRRRVRVTFALSAAAALILASCGDYGDGGTADASELDRVTVAFAAKAVTLDPNAAYQLPDVSTLHLIGGNLYRVLPDGDVKLSLAQSGVEAKDGLSWTFELRPDLRFSDGSPLTAGAVAASFERSMTNEANLFASFFEPIREVVAIGDGTVKFLLSRQYPSLPAVLAEPIGAILAPATLNGGESAFAEPISAGPYVLSSWGGDDQIVLKRNENWAGGPEPTIPEVVIETIPDFNERIAQVEGGSVDLAVDVPSTQIPQLTGTAKPQIAKLFGFHSLCLNNEAAPTNERDVRRAISMAIDRQRLVQDVWYDQTQPLAEFWPSTMTGHQGSYPLEPDVDGARELLDGTSCEDGCTVKLTYTEAYGWMPPTALLIQDDLGKIGIDVELSSVDATTHSSNEVDGKFQMLLNGLYDYGNLPDGFVQYGLGREYNAQSSRHKSAEADELVAAVLESSREEQASNLARVNEYFVEQAPYVTLADSIYVQATRLPEEIVQFGSPGVISVAPGL